MLFEFKGYEVKICPPQGMDVCVCVYFVFVLSCVYINGHSGSGLEN
jgi:hypothetical protein